MRHVLYFILVSIAIFAMCGFVPAPSHSEVVATVLILEAGGEPSAAAMPAVMEVIQTRALAGKCSWYNVVTRPHQFSCLKQGQGPAFNKAKMHSKWLQALYLAKNGTNTLYTKHATHYCTTAVKPAWVASARRVAVIDHHAFYTLATVRK